MGKVRESRRSQKRLSSHNSVYCENRQEDLSISLPSLETALIFLLTHLQIYTDEVSFHLVSQDEISELHQTFFQDPTPTDCITFPLDSPKAKATPHILGEAFLCPAIALAYATHYGIDPHEELTRYLIHTLLHLIGYEDTTPFKARKMRLQEEALLSLLKTHNLLLLPLSDKK